MKNFFYGVLGLLVGLQACGAAEWVLAQPKAANIDWEKVAWDDNWDRAFRPGRGGVIELTGVSTKSNSFEVIEFEKADGTPVVIEKIECTWDEFMDAMIKHDRDVALAGLELVTNGVMRILSE